MRAWAGHRRTQRHRPWAAGLALLGLAACQQPPQASSPVTAGAVAVAPAEPLDPGPSEANLVFQAPEAAPKAKPKAPAGKSEPKAAKPEPAKPEPAKPEPAKPEPAKPEPAKPEPAKPEEKKVDAGAGGAGATIGAGGSKPMPPPLPKNALPAGNFDATTASAFRTIAASTGGGVYAAATAGALPGQINRLLSSVKDVPDLDMALVIDTTGSMDDDIKAMRGAAGSMLANAFARTGKTRVAVVYYKDKTADCPWVTRIEAAFTEDKGAIASALARAQIGCGGDEPEHVYAAIYKAASGLSWRPEAVKLMVLIGDAPPHEDYSDVTRGSAMGKAKAVGIAVTTIIVGK